ncbi:MAG: ornithine cyclodeaminase family protein [Dehalococcoidia bacterium]
MPKKVLFISESEVSKVTNMQMALNCIDNAFQAFSRGEIYNFPRYRLPTSEGKYNFMSASWIEKGYAANKSYVSYKNGIDFNVMLYDAHGKGLIAIIEANLLGQIRTGAASGIATKYLSKKNSKVFGIVGSGYQSQTQLESVINVRDIKETYVYSRNKKNREIFANQMSEKFGISIKPLSYEEFIKIDFDILTTVTNSITPVVTKKMLTPGMHINAAGNNSWEKSEVDIDVISSSEHIICDEIEQARIECGELIRAYEKGVFNWEESFSLSEIVSGKHKLRKNDKDITLFESQGLALEDLAMAIEIYKIAIENNFGKIIKI